MGQPGPNWSGSVKPTEPDPFLRPSLAPATPIASTVTGVPWPSPAISGRASATKMLASSSFTFLPKESTSLSLSRPHATVT